MHQTRQIHAGFIPLTDCAPLVIAKELGFDVKHGISLILHREASWANIRDKAEAGVLDCAITLAPMPLASTLGLGGRAPVSMLALMATSLNGNAITVSTALYDAMVDADPTSVQAGGMAAAASLKRVIDRQQSAGAEPLTFGIVYPFSSHNYDLRYWLASAGIDPGNDVNLVVVPPPLIAGSLKTGRIDGFCVGEPWNSVAVADGSGVIVATKGELWDASPEKVLTVRTAFAEEDPDLTLGLIRALTEACIWLDDTANRLETAAILSRADYVGIAQSLIANALNGQLVRAPGFSGEAAKDVVVFSKAGANFPWVSHAAWILTQMIRWGQVSSAFDIAGVASRVYRPDLFRNAVAGLNIETPRHDRKAEGGGSFFGTDRFDPDDLVGYLNSQVLRDTTIDLQLFNSTSR